MKKVEIKKVQVNKTYIIASIIVFVVVIGSLIAVIVNNNKEAKTASENTYNMAAAKAYASLTAMTATIGWTHYSISAQLATLTEPELMGILKTSWESFSLV